MACCQFVTDLPANFGRFFIFITRSSAIAERPRCRVR